MVEGTNEGGYPRSLGWGGAVNVCWHVPGTALEAGRSTGTTKELGQCLAHARIATGRGSGRIAPARSARLLRAVGAAAAAATRRSRQQPSTAGMRCVGPVGTPENYLNFFSRYRIAVTGFDFSEGFDRGKAGKGVGLGHAVTRRPGPIDSVNSGLFLVLSGGTTNTADACLLSSSLPA